MPKKQQQCSLNYKKVHKSKGHPGCSLDCPWKGLKVQYVIVFRKVFCYAGWKSLHIPIAIIKLSGLNVFICIYIFCGRRIGPRNVRPIKKLGPSVLIGFPICLSTYVLAYLCAPCSRNRIRHQRVHVPYCRQSENGPIFLPGFVILLLTVL